MDAGTSADKEERLRLLAQATQVKRPVALLTLIDKLDSQEVDDDLILSVIEAVEAGIDLNNLFTAQVTEFVQETEEEEEEAPPTPETAAPIPVYRLGEGARLYFAADGMPVGPPVHHIFVSRLKYKQCFACELRGEEMCTPVYPAFKPGNILIFSAEPRVESGDFVFVKTRQSDEFVQIFFGSEDLVRLRPLNPQFPERTLRRFELKVVCKLVGRYEDF